MIQKQTQKTFEVHRAIGHYDIEGTIICIPAPRPGIETKLVQRLIDEQAENMFKQRMLESLFG